MDSTAPKDNNNSQGSAGQNPPPSPIQPGQFVVTGEDDVFKQPPAPPGPDVGAVSGAAPDEQNIEGSAPKLPPITSHNISPFSPLPQTEQTVPSGNITRNTSPPQQPNPTPYVPPPASPTSQPAQPSIISKLRKLLIVLVILAVLGLIAAAVWFFLLGRNELDQKSQVTEEESVVEAPSPLPKRTTGGFGQLPAATDESQASPSADQEDEKEE